MESKTKARKWLFVVAVGIIGLLVVFFIALAIGNIVTGNILDKTIARLKSEGFRVSPEGLMPVCSDIVLAPTDRTMAAYCPTILYGRKRQRKKQGRYKQHP